MQGNFAAAVTIFRQATHLSPGKSRYVLLLGQAFYKQGNMAEAVAEYRRALKMDPKNKEARESLKVAESKLGPRASRSADRDDE